jgi:hypothetical protein
MKIIARLKLRCFTSNMDARMMYTGGFLGIQFGPRDCHPTKEVDYLNNIPASLPASVGLTLRD